MILEEGDGRTYLIGWTRTCGGKYYSELVSKIMPSLYGSLDIYTTIPVLCEITEEEALEDYKPISADEEFLEKLIQNF